MTDARAIYPGARVRLQVLNHARARTATPSETYAAITIADPGCAHPEIAPSPLCRGVLRLAFADISPGDGATRGEAFGPADAALVWDFCTQVRQVGAALLIVSCRAGGSRSAAVAAAISRACNGEDAWFHTTFRPTRHVYRALMEAWETRGLAPP